MFDTLLVLGFCSASYSHSGAGPERETTPNLVSAWTLFCQPAINSANPSTPSTTAHQTITCDPERSAVYTKASGTRSIQSRTLPTVFSTPPLRSSSKAAAYFENAIVIQAPHSALRMH